MLTTNLVVLSLPLLLSLRIYFTYLINKCFVIFLISLLWNLIVVFLLIVTWLFVYLWSGIIFIANSPYCVTSCAYIPLLIVFRWCVHILLTTNLLFFLCLMRIMRIIDTLRFFHSLFNLSGKVKSCLTRHCIWLNRSFYLNGFGCLYCFMLACLVLLLSFY